MVDFLNDDVTFEGEVTANGSLEVNGGLTVGPGGTGYGEQGGDAAHRWRAYQRVQVLSKAHRDQYVSWRIANGVPITLENPGLVFRLDGSSTGLKEMSFDGENWFPEGPMPGDIHLHIGLTVPYGWAIMWGQVIPNVQTTYPALWAEAWPGLRVGSGLRIPDMRGRVPMGMGEGSPSLTLRNIGDQMGSELQALTTAQLPAHNHTGTTNGADRSLNHNHFTQFNNILGANPGGTTYNFKVAGSGNPAQSSYVDETANPSAGSTLQHVHNFTTNNTGSGQGHNNVQPSTVVNFKVKL